MQWTLMGNPNYPGILVDIVNYPEGRDFRALPKEMTHIKKVLVYNILPESQKQYAVFTKESPRIVGTH